MGLSPSARRGLSHFSRSENGTVPFATPYDAVRIALALILLTAAALKGHQLATQPVPETGLFTSRWFLICVVEFELFFGLWLFSGLYPRRTWQAAILCFTVFGCVSLYKALSGEATCGCFGRVPVNPWYTLMLDVAVVLTLSCCRPARGQASVAGGVTFHRRRAAGVAAVCVIVGVPAAVGMGSYRAAGLDDAGDVFGDSEFVVLEPETWVGKRFPLLNYIDIGDQLAEGEWVVVLYHDDCASCREVIPYYGQFGRVARTFGRAANVAPIELAPYHSPAFRWGASCRHGRVSEAKTWLVETPVECALQDGVVARVRCELQGVRPGGVVPVPLYRIEEEWAQHSVGLE